MNEHTSMVSRILVIINGSPTYIDYVLQNIFFLLFSLSSMTVNYYTIFNEQRDDDNER